MTDLPISRTDTTLRGIGLASAGYALFSVQDAIVKWLVADYSVPQIMFARSIVIILIAFALGGRRGLEAARTSRRKGALGARAGLMFVAWMLYYSAARQLELAQLTTIYFVAPIVVVVLAALILREHVTTIRWVAVIIGFIGAVLAANPGGEFATGPTLRAFLAAICWALSMVLARSISRTETTTSQMLFSNAFFAIACAAALPFMWKTPDLSGLGLMLLLGVASGLGQYLLYEGVRYAPASAIAPTEYTGLIWAFLFGFVIWDEIPAANVFAGALLIVSGSFLLVWAERGRHPLSTANAK